MGSACCRGRLLKGSTMKKLTITITMDDDAPEGGALLDALGELVKQVPVIVEQKTRVVEDDYSEYGVRCECKWTTPNA